MSNPIVESQLPPAVQGTLALVRERLEGYAAVMGRGKVASNDEILIQQKVLWTGVMRTIMEVPNAHFQLFWAEFLSHVLKHRKDCFSPERSLRGVQNLTIPTQDRRNFERLMHLAYMTCDPRSRALALRQVSLTRVLSGLQSEQTRQKFEGFYSL